MKNHLLLLITFLALSICLFTQTTSCQNHKEREEKGENLLNVPFFEVPDTINALFIGNSYTFRHNLPEIVKKLAEEGNPGLCFNTSSVTYGGRILKDHWRLKTQNFINCKSLSIEEQNSTIKYLEEIISEDSSDNFAVSALALHKKLLIKITSGKIEKWDVVVLQSYRDDLNEKDSLYFRYASLFADLIKKQGGEVVLYETAPTLQNSSALKSPPVKDDIVIKEKRFALLAKQLDATVIPMSLVAFTCQTQRPDLTLRYVKDGHPNQTMAFLTANTFYSALFGRSPEGMLLDRVKDTKPLDGFPELDPNGEPLEKVFSDELRTELQRIAWQSVLEFNSQHLNHD